MQWVLAFDANMVIHRNMAVVIIAALELAGFHCWKNSGAGEGEETKIGNLLEKGKLSLVFLRREEEFRNFLNRKPKLRLCCKTRGWRKSRGD